MMSVYEELPDKVIVVNGETHRLATAKVNAKIVYVAQQIGNLLALQCVRNTVRYFPADEKLFMKRKTPGGPQSCVMLTQAGIKRLLCSSRSPFVKDIGLAFGIDIFEQAYLSHEATTLSQIMKTFWGFSMETQYTVGRYKIDLYFVDHKIAVECDEQGHVTRRQEDSQRQCYIENQLNCKFVRYEPHKSGFCIFEVCNIILLEMSKKR